MHHIAKINFKEYIAKFYDGREAIGPNLATRHGAMTRWYDAMERWRDGAMRCSIAAIVYIAPYCTIASSRCQIQYVYTTATTLLDH